MKIVEHQIVQFQKSSTSISAASNSLRFNWTTSNSVTLKATTFNKSASLIKKLLWQLNIIAAVILYCFTVAQQNAQYVEQ